MATDSRSIRATTRSRTGSTSRATTRVALDRGHPAVLLSITVGVLLLLGLIMILSASLVSKDSPFLYFQKQLVWAAIGVAAFIVFSRLDYKRLRDGATSCSLRSLFCCSRS